MMIRGSPIGPLNTDMAYKCVPCFEIHGGAGGFMGTLHHVDFEKWGKGLSGHTGLL